MYRVLVLTLLLIATCHATAWSQGGNGNSYRDLVGDPPNPASDRFRQWVDTLVFQRDAEIPSEQRHVYYFSIFGDDKNDGSSPRAPKKSIEAAQQIIDNYGNPAHLELRFKRGERWYTTTGLNVNKDHVIIRGYGHPKLGQPEFYRFSEELLSDWSPVEGREGVYQTRWSQTGIPAWIFNENIGWDIPFCRTYELDDVVNLAPEIAGKFYFDERDRVIYVSLANGEISEQRIRVVEANDTIGCKLAGDMGRLEDIVFVGFGIDPESTSNQAAGIKVTGDGSKANIVKNAESYYCSSHAIHYNSGHFTSSGGIATFINCSAGFCQRNASGETIFNSYVFRGKQETIFSKCNARFGTLPDTTWFRPGVRELRGRSVFAHTAIFDADLLICDQMNVEGNAFGCARPTHYSDAESASTIDESRAYIIKEHFDQWRPGAGFDVASPRTVKRDGFYRGVIPGNMTGRSWTTALQSVGWTFNCRFDVDTSLVGTGTIGFYNAPPYIAGQNKPTVEFCDFLLRVGNTQRIRIPDYDPNRSADSTWSNCLFAVLGSPREVDIYGDPAFSHNAYFNTDGQFGNDDAPINILFDLELDEDYRPQVGDATYRTGTPSLLGVELDRLGNRRDLSAPSIGDLSASRN